ncbi:diacylglycerol kinase family protein [Tepidibacillus marianensis]|uniref:diacylglycerol kinase family protein n=1 Tax=Tepidibacillus marianensis TaxID=3131995 RepID=UPI0030D01DC2
MVLKKLINSFNFASEGITYTIRTQRSMKIHVAMSLVVLLIGMWLHFTLYDSFVILISIGMVMGMELVNTAIETIVDLVSPDIHPLAKIAKDVAAGSVLFITFIVILLGLLIMFPYLSSVYVQKGIVMHSANQSFFALLGLFLLLITYVLKAVWMGRHMISYQPHVLVGVLIYICTYLFLSERNTLTVLCLFFTSIVLFFLFRKGYSFWGLIQNLLISFVGCYLFFSVLF